jgi:hypothetical protein
MSISNLIELRTKTRQAPDAVWVLVGDVPAWVEDLPDTVIVKPGHSNFDFRALIGLHVDVIEVGNHGSLIGRVFEAVEAAKPKSRGLACLAGVAGLNEAHERVLTEAQRMMR